MILKALLAIQFRVSIQCFHFCVSDSLFLVQANFKTGQQVSGQLYSSATSTQAAVGLAKEDVYIAQLQEVLMSFDLMDGGNILSDSHAVFDKDCCNTSETEATIFSHAEKSTGHLAAPSQQAIRLQNPFATSCVRIHMIFLLCEYPDERLYIGVYRQAISSSSIRALTAAT